MMKPEGFDSTEAVMGNDYQQLPAGAYVGKILNAQATTSKSGRSMLVLALDIADGAYKDYFRHRYKTRKAIYPEAKWSNFYFQLTDRQSLGRFKGMLKALEESNEQWTVDGWDWNEDALKGLYVGTVYREEEFIGHDGDVHVGVKCAYVLPVKDLDKATIPERRCIDFQEQRQQQGDFGKPIPDEDIPF